MTKETEEKRFSGDSTAAAQMASVEVATAEASSMEACVAAAVAESANTASEGTQAKKATEIAASLVTPAPKGASEDVEKFADDSAKVEISSLEAAESMRLTEVIIAAEQKDSHETQITAQDVTSCSPQKSVSDVEKEDAICIKIHGAKNLENKGLFGKVDPYVQIQIGEGVVKSHSVKNCVNPEWNFTYQFPRRHLKGDILEFHVFDEDIGQDDSLGKASLSFEEAVNTGEMWLPLEHCSSGDILVSVTQEQWNSDSNTDNLVQGTDEEFVTMEICNSSSWDDRSLKDDLKKDDTLEDLSAQLPHENRMNRNEGNNEENIFVKNTAHVSDSVEVRPENEFVSLNFTIVGAKELEKSDYIGKSDPYLVVTYKDKVFKSKTVNNDHNPNWNFTVILEVNMTTPENLIVEVFDEDYDKDDMIGYKSFSVQELIDCCKIEEKWIKLDNCTSGELMFSSKVIRKEVKESFVIASETILTETLRQTTPEREKNQEFDKLHKKSCKMVVRRTDAEGNVVEEIYDERKGTPRNEKSVINISSGFEIDQLSTLNESISSDSLVHDLRDEEFLTPSITKASVAELNVLKLSDEDITKTVDNSMKSTVVSTNVSVGNIEFVSNDEELLEQIKGLQLSTKSKISGLMETIQETKSVETTNYVSRKIVKTIDVEGNISEEFIEESPAYSQNFVQYFTSSSKPFEEIESFRSHFVESFNDMKFSQDSESSKDSQLILQTSQSMKQSNQGKTDEKEFDSTPDTPVIHLSATPIHSSERSSDSNILLSEGNQGCGRLLYLG